MQKIQKLPIKIGDQIKVISGLDKNKVGKVLKINTKSNIEKQIKN